ncbi:response regulator [Planctobacterium marinum]|uniref:response regulator n=1 Tax=Planctobacterium marinum TaxID=1631968 RepID=UPI001E2B4FC4|nr:response regulator [Planctobacterium marinum]
MVSNKKYNILVIDDDPAVTDLICESLGDDYNMFVALAGAEGIVLATQKIPPDLIILDINLPGKDGHMVAQQLCQNECTKGVPIVFVTGLRDDNEVVKSYEVGGVDLVFKPLNIRVLKEKVKAHLRDHITRKELAQRCVTDPITHLQNTRGFNSHFNNLWLTARVLNQVVSLTFISLDNVDFLPRYQGINNREDFLHVFAKKLAFAFEGVHCEIARYFGYTFAVSALDKSPEQLQHILQTLMHTITRGTPDVGHCQDAELIASIGIAAGLVSDYSSSEGLKLAADKAWLQSRQENIEKRGIVLTIGT